MVVNLHAIEIQRIARAFLNIMDLERVANPKMSEVMSEGLSDGPTDAMLDEMSDECEYEC